MLRSFLRQRQEMEMSTPTRLGVMMSVSLLGGCVVPYGPEVYLLRVQQNHDEVVRACEAGDQTACAIRPFVEKAVAQAQEIVWWK
jgi:hypothetical protein